MSAGTNGLIQQGAKLVTGLPDILDELDLEVPPPERSQPSLLAEEKRVLKLLTTSPRYVDEISAEAGFSIARTLAALLSLEMKDLVCQLPGKLFVDKTG